MVHFIIMAFNQYVINNNMFIYSNSSKYSTNKPKKTRNMFSKEEDEIIMSQVNIRGSKRWASIAIFLKNRTAKQVRERWINYLSPDVLRKKWTQVEDDILQRLMKQNKCQWSKLTAYLPGRTDIMIKNRAMLIRRQLKNGKKDPLPEYDDTQECNHCSCSSDDNSGYLDVFQPDNNDSLDTVDYF